MVGELSIHGLLTDLEARAGSVGFAPCRWNELHLTQPAPADLLALFESEYALLLAVRSSFEAFRQTIDAVRPALLAYLASFEPLELPRDAYLLLVVPETADEHLREIWDVETDPFVCRKHVLHPTGEAGDWGPSLLRVTALAIGARPTPQDVDLEIELDPEVEIALARLAEKVKAEDVVRDWAENGAP